MVDGYARSRKTAFARSLSALSGRAFLDKDALTRRVAERLLTATRTTATPTTTFPRKLAHRDGYTAGLNTETPLRPHTSPSRTA